MSQRRFARSQCRKATKPPLARTAFSSCRAEMAIYGHLNSTRHGDGAAPSSPFGSSIMNPYEIFEGIQRWDATKGASDKGLLQGSRSSVTAGLDTGTEKSRDSCVVGASEHQYLQGVGKREAHVTCRHPVKHARAGSVKQLFAARKGRHVQGERDHGGVGAGDAGGAKLPRAEDA
jgi:hypothetical protein